MELGAFQRFKRCVQCDIVITNEQHRKCNRCCKEERMNNNNRENSLNECFAQQTDLSE